LLLTAIVNTSYWTGFLMFTCLHAEYGVMWHWCSIMYPLRYMYKTLLWYRSKLCDCCAVKQHPSWKNQFKGCHGYPWKTEHRTLIFKTLLKFRICGEKSRPRCLVK
jgi:hypothetical protein